MNIYEVQDKKPELMEVLLDIWESSVRATHTFLSEEEIQQIKTYVPQALAGVEHLAVAEDDAGNRLGFLGAEHGRLEMLFLAPQARGKGLGKELLRFGMERYGIRELTVNEQNPQAAGFYEHLGFETYKRTALDEEGSPYPLLYMRLTD